MPGYPSAASPTSARKSGIRAGSTPNFSRTPSASRIFFPLRSICTTRSPRTHCARSLSGVQMPTFSTRSSSDRDARGGGQRVVRLELDHGPYGDAHGRERFFQRMELREQRRLDAFAGLVAGPQPVAKRLDDVIGRNADVSRAGLDHLQHGLQHADHGAERPVLSLC